MTDKKSNEIEIKAGKKVPTGQPHTPQRKSIGASFTGNSADGLSLKVEREKSLSVIFGCDDELQASSLAYHCISALSAAELADGQVLGDQRHFMLSIVNDLEPKDAVERMLSVQLATTHVAMVRTARAMTKCDFQSQQEAYSNCYNRLARTYTAQMETLRKHRHGGKQTVTVQHVNVEDGGQAIVGNVSKGGVA
ncbi:hypothetical protein N9L47_04730 [Rhodobacteraceae bacterium]|nr:hypothetical protein [Paracoccaceae bacterium]